MSETNLSLRHLFDVSGKELAEVAPVGVRLDANATMLKEELRRRARRVSWAGVKDAINEKVEETLDVPLADIVVGGWKKYAKVMEYADPKKHPPEQINLVPLAEHRVKSEHHPYIEILVKSVPVAKIPIDLTLTLTFEGLELKIQDGKIKAIVAGTVKGKGTIAIEKNVLLDRTFATISLPGAVFFGDGIPLRN